jgi:2-polyprenyl-3-methyl-5-hydroxy-6-metoxy-1,4-benzoquinol methylase
VQDEPPDRVAMLEAYPEDYHAYHEYSSPLMARLKDRYYRRRAAEYRRRLARPRASVLDVGCSDGNFLAAMRATCPDWTLRGVDFNPRVVALGRARGLAIDEGTLEDVGYAPESFDLIVMHHMIEHAFDPFRTLALSRQLLRPGGLLVGETPNVDCWDMDVFGGYWGGLHAPRHTVLFTAESLARAARDASLDVVAISHALQPAHIALSVQHWLQAHAATRTRLRNGRAFYYPYLMLLCLPLSVLQVLTRRSGVITFTFRRPAA